MNQPIRVNRNAKSVLRSDIDTLELTNGDYLECENVEFNNEGTTFSDTPALGNDLKHEIPNKIIQNQKLRVLFNGVYSISLRLVLKNINGQVLSDVNTTTTSNDLAGMKAAFVLLGNNLLYGATITTFNDDIEYVEILLNANFQDWILEVYYDTDLRYDTRIVQEALSGSEIGGSQSGNVIPVSKKEINGNLFIISTCGREVSREIGQVLGISQSPFFDAAIQVNLFNHGLQFLDSIVIFGALYPEANGTWVVRVIDDDNIALEGSIGTVPTLGEGGKAFTSTNYYTEIGVQVDTGDNIYQYTRLIGTKKFGVVTTRQPDLDGHLGNDRYNLYFTDKYQDPRVFYYRGEFEEDGAISVLKPNGIYDYESVNEETINLLPQPKVRVEFVNQIQSGGQLESGNYIYGIVLRTETFAPSGISVLTNAVPVYAPNNDSNPNTRLFGTTGVTGKRNVISVTNIPEGQYDSIQLIAIQFASSGTESAITPYIVNTNKLTSNQTSIELQHTGNESLTLFPIDLLQLLSNAFKLAGSNVIVDNRLVYGDLVVDRQADLTAWVDTFDYSIVRNSIAASPFLNAPSRPATFEEYYTPENVYTGGGYMPYEWERFYIVAQFKNGNYSDGVFAFDVRFLPQGEYNANEFLSTNKRPRRDFTGDEYVDNQFGNNDANGGFLFQLGIELKNISWDFPINGLPARDVIERIFVCKRPTIKEVLGSGKIVQTLRYDFPTIRRVPFYPFNLPNAPTGSNQVNNDSLYAFICPEWFFNKEYVTSSIFGDEIILTANIRATETTISSGQLVARLYYDTNNNTDLFTTRVPITEAQYIGFGEEKDFSQVSPTIKFNKTMDYAVGVSQALFFEGTVIRVAASLDVLGYFDFFSDLVNAFYFRPISNKYGNVNQGEIEFTGYSIYPDEQKRVFGGKVFNQQLSTKGYVAEEFQSLILSFATGYILSSHSRVNTNLRTFDDTANGQPFGPSAYNTTNWFSQTIQDQDQYNFAYQLKEGIQISRPYDPNLFSAEFLRTRKAFSLEKPDNSIRDFFRQVLPLQFQDNDNNNGDITHLANVNGDLVTIQRYAVTREYTNSQGTLVNQDAGEILVGNSGFLNRKGQQLTVYGTQHKWSIIKGRTQGGKETLFWLNTDFNAILRYGADGTVNQSMRNYMQTFLREYTQIVRNKLTPADGQGIHGIWDEQLNSYLITARAWTDAASNWVQNGFYFVGGVVIFGETFGVPQLYECIVQNAGVDDTPNQRPDLWRKVDFRESKFYNVWTLVFSEKKDGFTEFYTFYPKIYFQQNERYFSSNPANEGEIWQHRLGEPLVYYGQEHEGFKTYVINFAKNLNKKFSAIGIVSLIKPFKILFESLFIKESGQEVRVTRLDRDEFRFQNTVNYSPIKNTLDNNGSNSGDSPDIRGIYLKIKFFFKAREKQKVNDIDVYTRITKRNQNKP